MLSLEDNDRPSTGNRKMYLRSVSWSDRSPTKPLPRPPFNAKARACLPPLSISRPKPEEWPTAGSDDLGVWPNPSTPGVRVGPAKLSWNDSDSEKSSREFECKKDKLAFLDKDCSRIAEHLYLGSDKVAKDREVLRKNGITHVLNCVGFFCPEYFKGDLMYKTLWLRDSPTEDITSILYDVFDYFEDVREQGGRVLVHCSQGVSRSTSLVIAYLMWKEGQSFEDAFQRVKAARGVTNPNMGFACQLLQCQKRVHAVPASPNSVLRMYRMAPHSPYDPLHLVPKMLSHPSADGLDSRGAFIVHVPSALYLWIGKNCDPVMSDSVRTAALQVVRYEKAQGLVLIIREGEEASEFWSALGVDTLKEAGAQVNIAASIHPAAGQRKVKDYDLDFEIFHRALSGGVVPPSALLRTGRETCLPARENGWGKLRRKFANGIMKDFIASSKLHSNTIQSSRGPDTTMDTCREVESCVPPSRIMSASSFSSSSFATNSPNQVKGNHKDIENTSHSDPALSPSPRRSSCFLLDNSKFSSSSPSLSPSTSEYSNPFTFSPSSSNWSDLSYISAQPSPSGLEYTVPYPAKNENSEESACINCKETSRLPVEAFSTSYAFRNTCFPCRGTSPSIAERRGSNPPPRMMLPSDDDAPHVQANLARSRSFSQPELGDGMTRDDDNNHFLQEESVNTDELMMEADITDSWQ